MDRIESNNDDAAASAHEYLASLPPEQVRTVFEQLPLAAISRFVIILHHGWHNNGHEQSWEEIQAAIFAKYDTTPDVEEVQAIYRAGIESLVQRLAAIALTDESRLSADEDVEEGAAVSDTDQLPPEDEAAGESDAAALATKDGFDPHLLLSPADQSVIADKPRKTRRPRQLRPTAAMHEQVKLEAQVSLFFLYRTNHTAEAIETFQRIKDLMLPRVRFYAERLVHVYQQSSIDLTAEDLIGEAYYGLERALMTLSQGSQDINLELVSALKEAMVEYINMLNPVSLTDLKVNLSGEKVIAQLEAAGMITDDSITSKQQKMIELAWLVDWHISGPPHQPLLGILS